MVLHEETAGGNYWSQRSGGLSVRQRNVTSLYEAATLLVPLDELKAVDSFCGPVIAAL